MMGSKTGPSNSVHCTASTARDPSSYTTRQRRHHMTQSVFVAKGLHAEENTQPQSAKICFWGSRSAPAFQRQQSGRRADGHTFEYGDGETNKYNSNYPPSPTERGETQLLSKINKLPCMA